MFNLFDKKDVQIQADVKKELHKDPSLRPSEVSVSTEDGIVTLRGHVPHYAEKIAATQAVQRVGGVRAVVNEIEVKLMGSYERTDSDIAETAAKLLEWNAKVPPGIKITVDHGWVTLQGESEWAYERGAAEEAVSQLMGVRGVSNLIGIKSKIEASNVRESIERALERSASIERHKISVTVEGDEVTLSGNVESWAEFNDADVAAWSAPGVMKVENHLKLAHTNPD